MAYVTSSRDVNDLCDMISDVTHDQSRDVIDDHE